MKKSPQHQVYPPPIITPEQYKTLLMADRQAREEYKIIRSNYMAMVRRNGYLLAVGRRDQIISDWESEQMEDLDGERTEQTI